MEVLSALVIKDIKHTTMIQPFVLVCLHCSYTINNTVAMEIILQILMSVLNQMVDVSMFVRMM